MGFGSQKGRSDVDRAGRLLFRSSVVENNDAEELKELAEGVVDELGIGGKEMSGKKVDCSEEIIPGIYIGLDEHENAALVDVVEIVELVVVVVVRVVVGMVGEEVRTDDDGDRPEAKIGKGVVTVGDDVTAIMLFKCSSLKISDETLDLTLFCTGDCIDNRLSLLTITPSSLSIITLTRSFFTNHKYFCR